MGLGQISNRVFMITDNAGYYLVGLLGNFRNNVLVNILELKQPFSNEGPTPQPEPAPPPELEPDKPPQPIPGPEPEPMQESVNVKVKFLQEVYQFVGKELECYGPYAKGDTADLPKDVADVLLRSGKAEDMTN